MLILNGTPIFLKRPDKRNNKLFLAVIFLCCFIIVSRDLKFEWEQQSFIVCFRFSQVNRSFSCAYLCQFRVKPNSKLQMFNKQHTFWILNQKKFINHHSSLNDICFSNVLCNKDIVDEERKKTEYDLEYNERQLLNFYSIRIIKYLFWKLNKCIQLELDLWDLMCKC